jgi:hypothetical protein
MRQVADRARQFSGAVIRTDMAGHFIHDMEVYQLVMYHLNFPTLAGVIIVCWVGFRWLVRHKPFIAIALVGFLRGLLGGR